ncbi:hypothetical protein CTKA_00477 [Chthonomonas calidirosea]|uniref:Anthrax toxin lethal/endema factor N-/C-terminal domain-containing protein n=1 Tax=Chthonomonas calidirosea (strain DSM 23976 / ICMP 18418 / T49) TaxID=1303518 RepID=S0EXI0_CHTCT|nr:hypothetical protein [Chthonomonas calidirosea]CCW34503.1 hypothetical protein CCALI_00678 [Chthonomonas calidirosea T49]CEK14597.1 hypothetical protein CTKA_00477 [Chthonomonas calidirosea]
MIARNPIKHLSMGTIFMAALLASLVGTKTVSAELRFYDDAPHASTWQAFYSQLPAIWKTDKIIIVQEVSHQQLAQIFKETYGYVPANVNDMDGCYQFGGERIDADATISILNTLHGDAAIEVFAHEYGHFVWDQLLDRAQRAAYRQLWQQQKAQHRLVTGYAATSPEEGFAETFAYFFCNRNELHAKDRPSETFLSALLDTPADKKQVAQATP